MSDLLANRDVLIAGQLITSRTETLEDYLKSRVRTLAVVGIAGAFAAENVARCSLYEHGALVRQFPLPSVRIRQMAWYKQPLLFVVFASWAFAILSAVVRLRRRFDIFVGISIFSAFLGLLLRRLGYVRRVIYYCLDYYPMPAHWNLNRLIVVAFRILDRWCARSADMVWNLSPRIAEARMRFGGLPPDRYRYLVVPLGYSSGLMRSHCFEEIEPSTIVFVGTLSPNQGLQLLVEAMPVITAQVPGVKVRIIGDGPFSQGLRRLVAESSQEDHFVFHGFVREESEMLDIISRCAIGVAPWISTAEDNSLYADPGKPKLYAFCGLPTIITNGPAVASEIHNRKAGIAINYDRDELAQAVITLLKNPQTLEEYRRNAAAFARDYTSERLFDLAFEQILSVFANRDHG